MPSHKDRDQLGMFEHQEKSHSIHGLDGMSGIASERISMLLLSNKLPQIWCLNACELPHNFCRTEVPQSSAGFLVMGLKPKMSAAMFPSEALGKNLLLL